MQKNIIGNYQKRTRFASKKGFTLIELLVVIAIIALLVSILLPSLHKAKELARAIVCSTNVSSVGKGIFVYAAENNDFQPTLIGDGADSSGGTSYQIGYYDNTPVVGGTPDSNTSGTLGGYNWYYKMMIGNYANDKEESLLCPSKKVAFASGCTLPTHYAAPFSRVLIPGSGYDASASHQLGKEANSSRVVLLHESMGPWDSSTGFYSGYSVSFAGLFPWAVQGGKWLKHPVSGGGMGKFFVTFTDGHVDDISAYSDQDDPTDSFDQLAESDAAQKIYGGVGANNWFAWYWEETPGAE